MRLRSILAKTALAMMVVLPIILFELFVAYTYGMRF
jgi:hypothetical protein